MIKSFLSFLIFFLSLYGHNEDKPFLKTFSPLWYEEENSIPPFIISSEGLSLFKKKELLESITVRSRSPYTLLWKRYIERYNFFYEWYFRVPFYSKGEMENISLALFYPHNFSLRELAPRKGAGIVVGCIDTGLGVITSDKRYVIHSALAEPLIDAPIVYYNCIEELTYKAFYNSKIPYVLWYSRFRFLEATMYEAVVRYLNDDSLDDFISFFKRYGNENLFTSKTRTEFSKKGYELIQIIKRRVEKVIPILFKNKKLPQDTLGYAFKSPDYSLSVNHGNGIAGIIAGKSDNYEGVAPEARILMAKAFLKDATCTVDTFLEALLAIIKYKVQLVCMSLQIPEEGVSDDKRELVTSLIKLIPYSVAPSGNDARSKNYVSFPASVATFSIGSFVYNYTNKTFPVASCSQYKEGEGPFYLMPGSAFLMPSDAYSSLGDEVSHNYVVSDGTSFAAAFTTGLLALFLAEDVEHDFIRSEVLTILYSSGTFLEDAPCWKLKSVLGTLDMSTALFIVLVLRAVKHESPVMRYFCEMYFEQCVNIMHVLLKKIGYSTKLKKEDSITFFKSIICSLMTKKNVIKEDIIPVLLWDTCCSLLNTPKEHIFSVVTRRLIKEHIQPEPVNYDLLVRVYGAYEAERIKEYVDSYIHYYW